MSHFSVLVITESPDDVEQALAPYQENNMGNCPTEYLEFHDLEDEFRQEWETEIDDMVAGPDGEKKYPWDDSFYREMTAEEKAAWAAASREERNQLFPHWKHKGSGCDGEVLIREFPEGWRPIKIARKDHWPTLEAYAEGYHGASRDPEKNRYGYWENPNRKWDWYSEGGRWSGLLAPDYVPEEDADNFEVCFLCRGTGKRDDELGKQLRVKDPNYTCNGCAGKGKSLKHPSSWKHKGNQLQVKDLDLKGLLEKNQRGLLEHWEECAEAYSKRPVEGMTFEEALKAWNDKLAELREKQEASGKAMHALIAEDELAVKLRGAGGVGGWDGIPEGFWDQEVYVDSAEPFSTFAVLKDGEWYERGEMGWFGMTANELSKRDWSKRYRELIEGLDPELWLTVIDCHI